VQPEPPEFSVGEIAKQISELDPRHRQIILMREFEGRSYSEISDKLGVRPAAVQALLVRARHALRDELELGITCAQARRISLRHLNSLAVRDERRALQRHLRRCDACATFLGHRRHSLASLLLLPTLVFRKLWALLIGTSSAPVGTTVGSGGATLAVKALTLAAIGSTAVGVTVTEITAPPSHSHSPAPPRTRPAATAVHHASMPVQSRRVTTLLSSRASSGAARPPLHDPTAQGRPHATAKRAPSAHSALAATVGPSTSVGELPPAAVSIETTEAPPAGQPASRAQAADAPTEPADGASSPAAPSPAPSATTATETRAPVKAVPTTTTSSDTPPLTTSNTGVDTSTSAPPPVSTPPSPHQPPTPTPGTGTGNGNGNGNVATPSSPGQPPTPTPGGGTGNGNRNGNEDVAAQRSPGQPPTPTPGVGVDNGNGNGNGNEHANGVGRDGTPPDDTRTEPPGQS
jgi:hypothetical protein